MDDLEEKLHNNIINSLSQWGNNLTENEKLAIKDLSEEYIAFLNPNPDTNKRLAIPLPTGFGKTLSIKEFIKLLIQENIQIGIVICQATLNEIEEVIASLLGDGVPEEFLGVSHRDNSRMNMSCFVTDDFIKNKQFIFITHQRIFRNVNNMTGLDDIIYFKEHKRITLWDESAITRDYSQVRVNELQGEIAYLNAVYNPISEAARNIHADEFKEFSQRVNNAINILKENHEEHITCSSVSSSFEWRRLPNNLQTRCQNIKEIIRFSGNDIEYVNTSHQPEMMVLLKEKIPPEMDNMLIFDASATHNKLVEFDDSVTIKEIDVERDYSKCNLYTINSNGSRSSLVRNPETRAAQIEAIKWIIDDIGKTEDTSLIFTLKHRQIENMNLPAELQAVIPNSIVLNWGNERGLNQYSEITTIATIGTLNIPTEDIQSMIIAQTRNKNYRPNNEEVESIQRSLQVVSLQQASTRGTGRRSNNGIAEAFDWILIHKHADEMAHELSNIFTGINIIKPNLPEHISEILMDHSGYMKQMVQAFSEIAENPEINIISMTQIRREVNIPFSTDSRVWTEKIKPDFERFIINTGLWIKEKRSYKRI